jgi:hypothetical protein
MLLCMLLVVAGTMQALLVCELLLRRVLFLCLQSRRLALHSYTDNAALSSFTALLLQMQTVLMQVLSSIVSTLGRFWALTVFGCICFAGLLILSSSSVHACTCSTAISDMLGMRHVCRGAVCE